MGRRGWHANDPRLTRASPDTNGSVVADPTLACAVRQQRPDIGAASGPRGEGSDFWRWHLGRHAHYLFLLVPLALRQNATLSPRNAFATVGRRLQRFVAPGNHTNVRGRCLFGY